MSKFKFVFEPLGIGPGDAGAYISSNRTSSPGSVSAAKSCLTCPHCWCVVRSEEWSASLRAEEDGEAVVFFGHGGTCDTTATKTKA